MLKTGLAALVVTSIAGIASPAFAAVNQIGTVDVDSRRDHDTKRFDLDGPVESLALRAERGNVRCRDISARFSDGRMHKVFSGELREGRTVNIDMPGASQVVTRLEFSCGASERSDARIAISADIERYRADWQRSPRWNSLWAGIFGAAPDRGPNSRYRDGNDRGGRDQWRQVGRETFSGRRDREQATIGWRGNRVESVALMAEGANAQCSSVMAEFGNGKRRTLDLRNKGFLPQDRYTALDLPGETRNLDGLRLRCRPAQGSEVTIGIYVNK